jgi:hypothetical protein
MAMKEKKSKKVQIRLTERENRQLAEAAKVRGTTKSEVFCSILAPHFKRRIEWEQNLFTRANKEIWISGVNSTGPAHQCYEELQEFLGRGGNLRFLIMNVKRKVFREQEVLERDKERRLFCEFLATYSILRKLNRKKTAGSLECKVYDRKPSFSGSIADVSSNKGSGIINKHTNRPGVRMLTTGSYLVRKGRNDGFEEVVSEYNGIWDQAETLPLTSAGAAKWLGKIQIKDVIGKGR